MNVDGSLRECLIKEETVVATVNQLRSRELKSFLAMVISSEAIERGFNVRYWSLSELVERLSKTEKKSEALKKINEADLLTIEDFGLGTLTAQEQSLVYEIIKSRAVNLSTIIVS